MLNLLPEYHEKPFPHLIFRDFIRDPDLLGYLKNNTELSTEMASRTDLGDLERIEIGRRLSGKYSYDFRKKHPFSSEFSRRVGRFLGYIQTCGALHHVIRKHFIPVFENEYENFEEAFVNPMVTYGAYNKTATAKNLIGWHLDKGDKLCSGFIYLREDGDEANDGHLQLSDGLTAKEIGYEDNVMVIWGNIPNAWHRAGVRGPTEHLRRIVNIVYESDKVYHDYRTERSDSVVDESELYSNKKFGFKKVNKL
tara:strand:+ start:2888 stop:3643 length:756 start_codon:yes stop_codon:yes gene_type:complete